MHVRKSYLLGAIAAATLTVVGVHAQNAPMAVPGNMDATRITSGTYAADAGHTLVGWRVNHFGFSDYFGIFGDVTGTLTLDRTNPSASKIDVTIPIANVTVASIGLREHLLRDGKDGAKPDFFGAAPTPARFVSTTVELGDEDGEAKITGNLTLNGVTRPVTLDVEFAGAGTNPFNKKETVGFEAETTIRRSEFGISFGVPIVSDEVELDISAAFEKQ